ncbi:putative Nodulation protein L [Blattamonas nauphoetae]|uniref:Nodulation protein L n=1 Tax=Blattamonas nauphoetae TaxID=2049346 RepID=A0ABQ9XKI2_9EUKA|nr:putative Nodulation protein L [Blattamonas nauphoetae]
MTEIKDYDETKSHRERMLSGQMYSGFDKELSGYREICSLEFLPKLNSVLTDSTIPAKEKRPVIDDLFRKYLGSYGEGSTIVPSFLADYGRYTFIGKNVFINMGCTFLDCAPITIEDEVMIAPNVSFFTASHPLRERERRQIAGGDEGLEYALPITIKKGAWIGGNVTILPGVTIGERAVIGAGSVVTSSVPADCVAAGNPAKVIRKIDQSETIDEDVLIKQYNDAKQAGRTANALLAAHTICNQRRRKQ